jgi:hypothetical protein
MLGGASQPAAKMRSKAAQSFFPHRCYHAEAWVTAPFSPYGGVWITRTRTGSSLTLLKVCGILAGKSRRLLAKLITLAADRGNSPPLYNIAGLADAGMAVRSCAVGLAHNAEEHFGILWPNQPSIVPVWLAVHIDTAERLADGFDDALAIRRQAAT